MMAGGMMAGNDFDPMRDVRIRGRTLDKLDREELLDALVQALWRLHEAERPAAQEAFRPAPRVSAIPARPAS